MVLNLNQNLIVGILAVLFIWTVLLTVLIFRIRNHYQKLTSGVSKKTLTEVLERLLKNQELSKEQIEELFQKIETQNKQNLTFFQKIGLLRFNPFEEVGSDQSFILSFLDGSDNGVILTSLTSRNGTRWYAKSIKKGVGVEHELSEEEKKVLRQASARGG